MSAWPAEDGAAVALSGLARERGRQQAARGGADAAAVRAAILARVEQARAAGLPDAAGNAYLAAQRRFHEDADPHSMAELAGIAEGFGIAEETLFAHLHLSLLSDRRRGGAVDADGCSAWAAGSGPEGPILVKNRDFSGTHLGIQRAMRHEGPDVATGAMLCVGSLGATGAYSSGINAAGLALADTAVSTSDHGTGWLRYFLMSRLLAECRDVGEAVAFIRTRVHAGGGTLMLADAAGAVAAVELGHRQVAVERGTLAFRTNHFVSPELAGATLPPERDAVAENSRARHAVLARELPGRAWSPQAAARLMARHADATHPAPLCQHGEDGQASTISSAVFACRARSLYLAEGNPCAGRWKRYALAR